MISETIFFAGFSLENSTRCSTVSTDLHVISGRGQPLEEEDASRGHLYGHQRHQHPRGRVERLQEGRRGDDARALGHLVGEGDTKGARAQGGREGGACPPNQYR